MISIAQITEIKTLPGIHDHEDENKKSEAEKFRQKLKKVQKAPNC